MVLLNPKQQTLMNYNRNTFQEVCEINELDTLGGLPNYFRDLSEKEYELCRNTLSWISWEDLDYRTSLEKTFSNS